MSKLNRKKIAVTLAFAALFGNKTYAMNSKYEASGAFNAQKSSKSGAGVLKPGGTLNIRSDSSGNKFFNWVKNHKAVSVAVPSVVVATAFGFTIWGVKHKNKDNQNPGDQKPSDQNKENLPPNIQQNIPTQQQQAIQQYGKYVGQQNAQCFAVAIASAADIQFPKGYIDKLSSHLSSDIPSIVEIKKLQDFSSLAGLKSKNVLFRFRKEQNMTIYFDVFVDSRVYTIYYVNDELIIFCGIINSSDNQWQAIDKIVIKNGVLSEHGLQQQQSQ